MEIISHTIFLHLHYLYIHNLLYSYILMLIWLYFFINVNKIVYIVYF